MSTDLFFTQPIPQNPSNGIQSDKIGPSVLDRSSGIQTLHESPKGDRDNFLITLKQAAQDRSPSKRIEHAAESRSIKTTAAVLGGKIDDASDDEATPAVASAQTEQVAEPNQMPTEWNLTAFIKVLERMGFQDAIGASDLQNMAEQNPTDSNQLTDIKSLFARLQQHQFGPTVDLKASLEHLQQFRTTALRSNDGISGQGLSPSQVTDLVQLNQWLIGLTPVTQNSDALSQMENRSEADPKLTTDSRPLDVKNNHDSKTALKIESADPDAFKIKEAVDFGRNPQTETRTEVQGWMATTPDPEQQADTANRRDYPSIKPSASSGSQPAVVKMSESQIQITSGEEPLSKVFQETQLVKEGVVKVESGSTEETVSKVIKTEAGSNDNGLLNSSGHNLEKAAETVAVQKETEAGQRDLRNQTMDQIVRKAATRAEVQGRMATTPDPEQQADTANRRDNPSIKPSATSGSQPAVVKMSESQIQSTSGEEPLSKVFQETQLVKEGVVKVESGSTEETVSKVIKTEAGSNDNGLLNSSGHNLEKAAETAAVQKETEAGQRDLRNQTMDQIVRKAAIHLRNGQHEARIELKPDFLGHIRMQVISDNHQVTVKILAEHGVVKDMIESNIHRLKADLQQQGLEVDKLEVSVSRDSEDSGNFKDKFAQSKARPNKADHQNEDHPAEEKQRETGEPVRTADGATAVDYFA